MKKKFLIFTVLFLVTDLLTKYMVNIKFNLNETKEVITNFFSITKVYNYGSSWGLFNGYNVFIIIVTIIVLILLIIYQRHFTINNRNILAFSLLYGGILGNLINRVFLGYVIDFLDFIIFGYDYPVFNFADICIVISVVLLGIAIIKKEDLNEVTSIRKRRKNR